MSETLDDLMVGIKLGIDEKSAQKAQSGISSFRRQSMMMLKPLAGAFAGGAVANFTLDIIKAKDNAMMLSKQLKIGANELYRMEKVSAKFDTSFSGALLGLQNTFAGFNQEEINGIIQSMGKFGINIDPIIDKAYDPKGLYDELAKQWPALSIEQRVKLSSALGLDQGTQNMLANQDRVAEYYSQTTVMTPQEFEDAKKAQEAMDKMGLTMGNVLNAISNDLTPLVQKIADFVGDIETETLVKAIYALVAVMSIGKVSKKVLSSRKAGKDKAISTQKKEISTYEKTKSSADKKEEQVTRNKRLTKDTKNPEIKLERQAKQNRLERELAGLRERQAAAATKVLDAEKKLGKSFFSKKLGEIAVKRGAFAASGLTTGVGSVVTGTLGLGLAAYDIYSLLGEIKPGDFTGDLGKPTPYWPMPQNLNDSIPKYPLQPSIDNPNPDLPKYQVQSPTDDSNPSLPKYQVQSPMDDSNPSLPKYQVQSPMDDSNPSLPQYQPQTSPEEYNQAAFYQSSSVGNMFTGGEAGQEARAREAGYKDFNQTNTYHITTSGDFDFRKALEDVQREQLRDVEMEAE